MMLSMRLFKFTLDCVDGYHGIELAEEDRHKTDYLCNRMGKIPQQEGAPRIPVIR